MVVRLPAWRRVGLRQQDTDLRAPFAVGPPASRGAAASTAGGDGGEGRCQQGGDSEPRVHAWHRMLLPYLYMRTIETAGAQLPTISPSSLTPARALAAPLMSPRVTGRRGRPRRRPPNMS